MSDRRVLAEIDLTAIDHNIEELYKIMPTPKPIMAVVKADGYGHGAVEIAKHLNDNNKIYGFATATSEEALALRKNNITKPILVLGYVFKEDYIDLINNDINITIFDYDSLNELINVSNALNKKVNVHIKVDTGMSRIGIKPDEEGIEFVKSVFDTPQLALNGIFTHFARADEADTENVLSKYNIFDSFIKKCNFLDLNKIIIHCANSASILQLPMTHLSCVRAGIVLYGLWPSVDMMNISVALQPVMSLKSHIIFIKEISAGTAISYGETFVAEKDMKIATVPVGYADGYPRSLSNKGYVIIKNKKAPILGRVCMDQMMVDVTGIDAKTEDEVLLLGKSGDNFISAEEMGRDSNRFNYELVCDISPRVPRKFIY